MKAVVYVILSLLNFSLAKNVLMIQCTAARSYSNIFEAIAVTLASEHNVTLINTHKLNENHPNVTFIGFGKNAIDIGGMFKDMFKLSIVQDDNRIMGIDAVLHDSRKYVDGLMNDPATRYVFETKSLYDIVIIATALSPMFLPFAHLLNVPLVQVATSYPMPWQNEDIGNPNYISTDNSLFLEPNSESFYGRLVKFIQGLKLLFRYHFDYMPKMNRYTEKYFPPGTPRIEEISANTSLMLVNTQEAMVMVRPKVPNFIEIGGIHCRPAKVLSPELDSFVQHPEGVIYMSLGLTVNTTFPPGVLTSIFNVFRKLPQRVIFKLGQDVDDVPSNVLLLNSCPQQDILGHLHTKLFITQGGMLSLQEAVYHGVPLLVLPFTLDQPTNALVVEKLGYGRYLRWSQFSEDTFFRGISEVLSNPKYARRAKELSALSKDVSTDPKENLRRWINHVLHHKGFPLSESNRHNYNRSTYHIDGDILLFINCAAVLVIVLLIFITGFVLRYVNKKIKIE